MLLPWWGQFAGQTLTDSTPNYSNFLWQLWPGNLIQIPDWQVLLSPALYQGWGSNTPIDASFPWPFLVGLFIITAALYLKPQLTPPTDQNCD